MQSQQKILVIRFSSIGDIVLASPVFRCLKKQLPGCEIHLVTKLKFKAVTLHNPYIDKFFYFDNDLAGLVEKLKAEDYDHVVDLHKNIRSLQITKALMTKTYTINKLSLQKIILTKLKINIMPGRHITFRSLDAVKKLGVQDDGMGLDYFISEDEETSLKDIPASHHAGYIAIAIGASYFTKRLPVDKLKALCANIHHPIILLGGPEDAATGDEIRLQDGVKIYNACGKFSLNESADLVRKSKLLISHDTGLLYIGCAFKRPTFAIWGGTTPALDVFPFYGSVFMQQNPVPVFKNFIVGTWCQPCSKYGKKACPLGHFNCMEKQDVAEIARLCEQWIRGVR